MFNIGLDNGLILHSRNMIKAAERPPKVTSLGAHDNYEGHPEFDYEVLYWRKCWNLRTAVARALELPHDYVHKFDLSIEDIKAIWHVVNEHNNKHVWEDGSSIWSYDEMHDHLDSDLLSLEWLIHFMRTHRDNEYMVEFYDSY